MTDEQPPSTTTQPDTPPDVSIQATVKGSFELGTRKFGYAENPHGKTQRRTFAIWQEGVAAGRVSYEPDPSPIKEDETWYHRYATRWYREAAILVAQAYVDQNSQWPTTVNEVRVHGHEYKMERE